MTGSGLIFPAPLISIVNFKVSEETILEKSHGNQ
jgi:hypothetical protein